MVLEEHSCLTLVQGLSVKIDQTDAKARVWSDLEVSLHVQGNYCNKGVQRMSSDEVNKIV